MQDSGLDMPVLEERRSGRKGKKKKKNYERRSIDLAAASNKDDDDDVDEVPSSLGPGSKHRSTLSLRALEPRRMSSRARPFLCNFVQLTMGIAYAEQHFLARCEVQSVSRRSS